jgi:hypothetical protein
VASKNLVFHHPDDYVKVAGDPAHLAWFTFATQS